jgi:hypothetical protein
MGSFSDFASCREIGTTPVCGMGQVDVGMKRERKSAVTSRPPRFSMLFEPEMSLRDTYRILPGAGTAKSGTITLWRHRNQYKKKHGYECNRRQPTPQQILTSKDILRTTLVLSHDLFVPFAPA